MTKFHPLLLAILIVSGIAPPAVLAAQSDRGARQSSVVSAAADNSAGQTHKNFHSSRDPGVVAKHAKGKFRGAKRATAKRNRHGTRAKNGKKA